MIKMLRPVIPVLAVLTLVPSKLNCQLRGDIDLDAAKWEPLKTLLEKKVEDISFKLLLPTIAQSELETTLSRKYDLVEIHVTPDDLAFSIKRLEQSTKLLVDGLSTDPVDFYDLWIEVPQVGKYQWLSIAGYLLFPKRINSITTKTIVLQYKDKKLTWDLEKINKMIEILK